MAKANVYDMVTDRIIAELEKGQIPWEKPWTGVQSGGEKAQNYLCCFNLQMQP